MTGFCPLDEWHREGCDTNRTGPGGNYRASFKGLPSSEVKLNVWIESFEQGIMSSIDLRTILYCKDNDD